MRGVKDKLIGKDQVLEWKKAAACERVGDFQPAEREYQPGL
jgi:hypothetical protein